MADYQNLKDAIKDVIKTNGNQEITGQIMQNALVSIINALQAGAMYAGVAKPTTNPGTPDQNLFYLAFEDGIYSNFGGVELKNETAIFSNVTGDWVVAKDIFANPFTQRVVLSGQLLKYNTPANYDDTILEVYLSVPISDNSTILIKNYANTIYFRPQINGQPNTYLWQSATRCDTFENGKVYELKCTTAGNGVNIGDIVGYIVFKDIDKFRAEVYGGYGIELISPYVKRISNFPIIVNYIYGAVTTEKLADGAVTKEKLADGAVTKEKLADDVYSKLFSYEAIEIKKEYNNNYIAKNAKITKTTSQRAVAVYEIVPNSKLRLHIPKNGNSYSITYIYLNNLDDKIGVLPSDGGIEGSETEINFEFTAENYGFLAVTYTTTDGKPTLLINIESKYTDVAKVKELIAQEIDKITPQLFIDGVDLFLPNKFYAVKNDTLQIFIRSIVKAKDPYIFDVIGKCQVGNMYPRYYVLPKTTANNNIGKTFDVEFVVRNNNLNDMIRKTSQLQVLDFPQSPSSNKNVLCVGASATAGGQWVFELNRRLTGVDGDGTALNPTGLGLTNITFVGRKTGTSKAIKLEATGGWSVTTYAGKGRQTFRFFVNNVNEINVEDVYGYGTTNFTVAEINVTGGVGNISCLYSGTEPTLPASGILERVTGSGDAQITYQSYESEYYNPFYNSAADKLDFTTYANNYCDGSIDYFVWHCGVNGIFGGTDSGVESEINSFKTILRAFHEEFPNSKVIISSVPIGSPTGGFCANYGTSLTSNYYTFLKQAMNYAKALIELCADEEFSPYTYYCPAMEEFDCENSYPYTEVDVNNRVAVKVQLGTNGVHPTDDGYKLVADAMYRTMCYVLSL